MPTPTGLFKAGDKLVDDHGVIYHVMSRTSSSVPYSIWIRREDGQRISGFRNENLRGGGREARLPLETGALPGNWQLWDESMVVPPAGRYNPPRAIRVRDAHRWKDAAEARYYGEECELSIGFTTKLPTVIVMSDSEAMEMAIRLLTYLQGKVQP